MKKIKLLVSIFLVLSIVGLVFFTKINETARES